MEPIPASGERYQESFDINDLFLKKEASAVDLKNKGILPRIKNLSGKRRSSIEKPKKYKYNLKTTPAEKLFGSSSHSYEATGHKGNTNGNVFQNGTPKDAPEVHFRPTSRLNNYKDMNSISLDVNGSYVENKNSFSNQRIAMPPPNVVIPSPPPSSLLLQIAPEQNKISVSNNGINVASDKSSPNARTSSVEGFDKFHSTIYTEVDHSRKETGNRYLTNYIVI